MAFSSLESFLASFFSAFLAFLPALFAAFLPALFAFLTLAAIFFFRAAILRRAALCSLLPFLYLLIFALSACMAFSSFESFFFRAFFLPLFLEFLAFSLCSFSFSFLAFPLYLDFLALLRATCALSAAILRRAALCSL